MRWFAPDPRAGLIKTYCFRKRQIIYDSRNLSSLTRSKSTIFLIKKISIFQKFILIRNAIIKRSFEQNWNSKIFSLFSNNIVASNDRAVKVNSLNRVIIKRAKSGKKEYWRTSKNGRAAINRLKDFFYSYKNEILLFVNLPTTTKDHLLKSKLVWSKYNCLNRIHKQEQALLLAVQSMCGRKSFLNKLFLILINKLIKFLNIKLIN